MSPMPFDPELESVAALAATRRDLATLTALIQLQSSRRGLCSRSDCGDCPLGLSGCVSGDRFDRTAQYLGAFVPQFQVA